MGSLFSKTQIEKPPSEPRELTILLMGESGSGKTSLLNLIFYSIEKIPLDDKLKNLRKMSSNDSPGLKYKSNTKETFSQQNLAQTVIPEVFEIGYDVHKLILIDTPGIYLNLEGDPDSKALENYISLMKRQIDIIIYVQKANDLHLSRTTSGTLNALKEKINLFKIKFLLFFTFYPGSIIFQEKLLPFTISKTFNLDNTLFINAEKYFLKNKITKKWNKSKKIIDELLAEVIRTK